MHCKLCYALCFNKNTWIGGVDTIDALGFILVKADARGENRKLILKKLVLRK